MYSAIANVYFAFTTLSTVGFGDYYPMNNFERLFCAFILVLGVLIFSYLMDVFLSIICDLQNLTKDLDDGDNLTKFFSVL